MLWKAFLLVGLIVMGIRDCSFRFVDINKNNEDFSISVEYVVFHFNENQDDNFAYKFLRVRRSQSQRNKLLFLVDLEMGRTICKKFEEDIDNCPLQEGQGEKKTYSSGALRGREGQTPLRPFDRGTMTKYLCPFMLILIIPVALAVGGDQAKNEVKALRYFESINISNANVKQCVWFAMKEYNKGSKDKYVFLVDRTLHAKLQITDRMEYQINVQIARSNCKKPLNNTVNCVTQKNSKLEKKVNCSFLVGALPWNGVFTLLDKDCKDI
ncbi:cystatin-8 isoform X3 [Microtus ochrogaster]|uniref:Cystatin-8 isoform X3 n=2 Tax=Microtus ochrogaster TaxID=79684 RepID=A0ABM0LGA2_MICOH|nr:cystatin-8 isoform X3 [Microtus ochrogaster]